MQVQIECVLEKIFGKFRMDLLNAWIEHIVCVYMRRDSVYMCLCENCVYEYRVFCMSQNVHCYS